MIKIIKDVSEATKSTIEVEVDDTYAGLKYYVKTLKRTSLLGRLEMHFVNGYVRIPEGHNLYGELYYDGLEELLNSNNIELSYSGFDPQTESTDWSIGFTGNTKDIEAVKYDCQDLITSIGIL